MQYISQLNKLVYLDISYNTVTYNGAKHLQTMKLEYLNIQHNYLRKEGAKYIGKI